MNTVKISVFIPKEDAKKFAHLCTELESNKSQAFLWLLANAPTLLDMWRANEMAKS